jgi:hypothetical protein
MSEKANLGPVQPGLEAGILATRDLLLLNTGEAPALPDTSVTYPYADHGSVMLSPIDWVEMPSDKVRHGPEACHSQRWVSTPSNRNNGLQRPVI